MKKIVLILFISIIIFASVTHAQYKAPGAEDITYGKITVYSDVLGADIYVDAKFVGQDRATISNIPTGKHYVRVAKGEETIQSGIVTVNEGEETIIVAKTAADRLLARRRKPNYVFFYGGYTDLDYISTVPTGQPVVAGEYKYAYKPQYGFGGEVQFAVPNIDLRVDVGFAQNYPGAISITSTKEANLAVSTPYINISKNFFKTPLVKISGGLGFNYAIYSPGFQTEITIETRSGYHVFVEAVRSSGKNQIFILRLGYVVYNGRGVGSVKTATDTYQNFPIDISSPGYYIQGGVAYQL